MLIFYWIFILVRFAEINSLPTESHYGTDFYIGTFQFRSESHTINLDIASQEEGTAVLSVPYLNIHRNVTIQRGATTLTVNGTIMKHGTFVETRGIHIQTDVPVSVFVTTVPAIDVLDTYLALPVTALGTSYKVATYDPWSEDEAFFSVIGINENTNVTTSFRNQTTTITTLHPLSIGQCESKQDLTGTYIKSDKVIAVSSGATCAYVRPFHSCDYISEQMVPVKQWQKVFIVPPVFPRQGFILKILKIQHEDVCLKNRTNTICNLQSGEVLMGTEPVIVTSAAPISVVQYGVDDSYDGEFGGPFMTVIPGIGNYLNDYYFVVPYFYRDKQNYLSVIVYSTQTQELYLDGLSLNVLQQYAVPDPFSNYTVIIANITVGYHRLWHANSNVMFGATVYGLSFLRGYGFPVGFAFIKDHVDGQAKCYHCDDMSTLQVCNAVIQCEKNQVCYAEKYYSNAGTYFKSGCIDSHQCHLNLTKNPHAVCAECCYEDFCNNKGCGDNSFPDRNHRGPMCYDCMHVMGDPGQCNKVTLCASNEVCSIEQYRWGDDVYYQMGCAHQWCIPIKRSVLTNRVERSTPLCSHCCSSDFCNHNCTGAGDGNSGPAIVG